MTDAAEKKSDEEREQEKGQELSLDNYTLPEPNLKGGDFARTVYSALIPEGTPFEALVQPEYWSLVSHKVMQYDKIEVIEESGAYYGELLIMSRGINRVDVAVLGFKELEVVPVSEQDERYKVVYKGPRKKHCILDTKDGKIIQEGIARKSDAYRQLEDRLAVLAR